VIINWCVDLEHAELLVSAWEPNGASLLDYVVLRYPGFGWPAELHNEGAIPTVIVGANVLSLLNPSRSNYASPVTNDTMLVEYRAAKQKTSAITQIQFQTIEYVAGLPWIV
jgi:hypothetical protein